MHHEVRAAAEADDRFRFQAIYACVPECVKLIDANERLIDMNPAGLRMIDAPSLDLVRNRHILDLIAPSHRQAFSEAHAAVFQGRAVRLQFEVVGFSGRKLWMDQSAAPLFDCDDSRRVVEMVAVTRDITAQRESESELLQARIAEEMARSRAEFIAGIGHELNVPLNEVIGYGELLQETALEHGRCGDAQDLQRVIDAARQILAMMHRMAGAASSAPRQGIRAGACDLREIVEDAIEGARTVLEGNGISVSIELPREPQLWQGDWRKLDMCLRSLLLSTAKLAQNGSLVARLPVPIEAGGPWIRVEFAIAGVAAAASARALEDPTPFQSGVESIAELPRRLARLMGGDLLVTNAHREDTVITLTLPV